MEIIFLLVFCVSILYDDLIFRSEVSYRVFLRQTQYEVGTITNSHYSLQFGCSSTEYQ